MSEKQQQAQTSKPRSSVRHTRAIQGERNKQVLREPAAEEVEQLLTEVVSPAVYAQVSSYQAMGLRQRLLTLPVMVAFVLSLVWRQVGAVSELVRELNKRGLLWAKPTVVSQQAVSERLRTFPHELFHGVLLTVLPQMQERWRQRQRPLWPVMQRVLPHFTGVWILDGSTLDTLLRKVGLLREGEGVVLAGRIGALLDAVSLLPQQVWYEAESQAHDQTFWSRALAQLPKGVLLLFDLGFVNYTWFDELTAQGHFFLTRAKGNAVVKVEQLLQRSAQVHDQLVWLGSPQTHCTHLMRLVAVEYKGKWYRYLTNVLDPNRLSVEDVVLLYQQRWRIEDAFHVAKRLLGLAYFWVGSINGVQTQIWATWLFYVLLVDLTDTVAEAMQRPFVHLSLEMVFKALYHFTQEKQLGRAADPIAYLVQDAHLLGIVKPKYRKWLPLTIDSEP